MSWLAEEVATPAMCWRVERVDGVAIGLTAHDRDLVVDGLVHRATPGMTLSAVTRAAGLEADTSDVGGALSGAAIDERDLLAGRWDGARVVLFVVDWTDVSRRVDLSEGTIGAVELAEGGFVAEVAGPGADLDRTVAEETSPGCRATLGDKRCRVAMAGRRRFARVVAAAGESVTVDAREAVADAYGGGRRAAAVVRRCERRAGGGGGALRRGGGDAGGGAGVRGGRGRSGRAGRGVRRNLGDVRRAVRQCGELSRGAAPAGDGPGDAVDRRVSAVVERARALIGVRFRVHGRDADGLDCVGLAALAFGMKGVPSGYPLRGGSIERVSAAMWARLRVASGARAAGDLLLMETGPAQWHLGVWTGDGLVHADLGLGRVVERPGEPPWPVVAGWRG